MSVVCFLQAEDGIRDWSVPGVQTCALPICQLCHFSNVQTQARSRPAPTLSMTVSQDRLLNSERVVAKIATRIKVAPVKPKADCSFAATASPTMPPGARGSVILSV